MYYVINNSVCIIHVANMQIRITFQLGTKLCLSLHICKYTDFSIRFNFNFFPVISLEVLLNYCLNKSELGQVGGSTTLLR